MPTTSNQGVITEEMYAKQVEKQQQRSKAKMNTENVLLYGTAVAIPVFLIIMSLL